jgi:hypothetical protein
MTTQTENRDNSNGSIAGRKSTHSRREYHKPTLKKGPLLTSVTAAPQPGPLSRIIVNPPCWVARAAFGEADFRWMIFRAWLMEDAPGWFQRLYLRYGEATGARLANHHGARAIVRAFMLFAVRSKLQR